MSPLLLPLHKTLLMLMLAPLMPLPLPPLLVGVEVEVVEVVMLPELPETKRALRIKAGQVIQGQMQEVMGLVLVITKVVLPP
jgi:hypothetical protein